MEESKEGNTSEVLTLQEALDEMAKLTLRQQAVLVAVEASIAETKQNVDEYQSESALYLKELCREFAGFTDKNLVEAMPEPEEPDVDEEKTFLVTFETVDSLGFSVALMRDRDQDTTHIIVDKIFDACPSKAELQVLDELVALNNDPIANVESKDRFNDVVSQIRTGPRPIAITFRRLSRRYLQANLVTDDLSS